ncbi:MAG: phenylalanine--tRNA ligase beta subunit-related protein [Bacillota bacterium]
MRFTVEESVFNKLEDVCFGVVVARGIDNVTKINKINEMLENSIKEINEKMRNEKIKEHPKIIPYRNAFARLGFNPNKFAPSVEALITRILKGGQMPSINNIVDLANAISIKYILPIGAHDIALAKDNIAVRFAVNGDTFIPFGAAEAESLEPGELVYASGSDIKTRRWIWRQSEQGKITEKSSHIFFPIDGFISENCDAVILARDELAEALRDLFNCDVKVGFVDRHNQSMSLD